MREFQNKPLQEVREHKHPFPSLLLWKSVSFGFERNKATMTDIQIFREVFFIFCSKITITSAYDIVFYNESLLDDWALVLCFHYVVWQCNSDLGPAGQEVATAATKASSQ